VAHRIQWVRSDGWSQVSGRFDVVLCNPPYVADVRMQALPAEFRAEPDVSLRGGVDGMDFIRPFLQSLAPHLHEGGWLVLEIGHEREGFERAFPQLDPLWLGTSAGDDAVLALSQAQVLSLMNPAGTGT
jgi:ribosomal protein L3 glutamine methyltransferase